MHKNSVKIGWTENREGFYGSAVNYENSKPLGTIVIVSSNSRYEMTVYSFKREIKVDYAPKTQAIPNIKGLTRAMMLTLVDAEI